MRYLVNLKTKEHRIDNPEAHSYHDWRIVEADSEGWIAHTGNECPLPDDVFCAVKCAGGLNGLSLKSGYYGWTGEPEYTKITHYRPILRGTGYE